MDTFYMDVHYVWINMDLGPNTQISLKLSKNVFLTIRSQNRDIDLLRSGFCVKSHSASCTFWSKKPNIRARKSLETPPSDPESHPGRSAHPFRLYSQCPCPIIGPMGGIRAIIGPVALFFYIFSYFCQPRLCMSITSY